MPAFLGRLLLTGVAGRRNKGSLQGIPYLLQNRESRLEKRSLYYCFMADRVLRLILLNCLILSHFLLIGLSSCMTK